MHLFTAFIHTLKLSCVQLRVKLSKYLGFGFGCVAETLPNAAYRLPRGHGIDLRRFNSVSASSTLRAGGMVNFFPLRPELSGKHSLPDSTKMVCNFEFSCQHESSSSDQLSYLTIRKVTQQQEACTTSIIRHEEESSWKSNLSLKNISLSANQPVLSSS